MIEVRQMRDFVRDDVAADVRRREDQAPAEPNAAVGRTAAPARPGVADGHAGRLHAGRLAIFGDLGRHRLQRPSLEPGRHPALESVDRTAAAYFAWQETRRPKFALDPNEVRFLALNRN